MPAAISSRRIRAGLAVAVVTPIVLGGPGATAGPPPPDLGVFEGEADLGTPARPGSAGYDAEAQRYVVEGSGGCIESSRDEAHFVWKRLRGDFILTARVELLGDKGHARRQAGWIARSGLEPEAAHLAVAVHGDGQTAMRSRRPRGGRVEERRSPIHGASVLQLARRGATWSMSVARFGEPFAPPLELEADLGDEVLAGLFVCSRESDSSARALFRNVRIVVPAGEDLVPYEDYLGSRLEILDVASGDRTVVHSVADSLQAPNWTPDGRELIYNRNGLLYRFDLANRKASVLDTGFADRNNNDHVLSFDGTMLGISHHDPGTDGHSIVYTLPAAGGVPKRVTERGPSYLHGWSPDGRYLLYTAERDGDYDIYRIPADGGEEVRLTSAPGLDDGSEYSPDGRWIYFNSVRSGTMQIWRMRPDGSEPEQLTDDGFNNWFPHLSPDGESVVFLSYGADVAPSDHPFYRQVYLRLMPAEGGEPKVVAYVYGGQGTINVPSWAPDGRRLAFVSNTGGD